FFSSRRRHTRCLSDWSSDVCSSDLSRPANLTDQLESHLLGFLIVAAHQNVAFDRFVSSERLRSKILERRCETYAWRQKLFRLLGDRKSTRLNSSHLGISYAVFCLKK